jgi:hypothetical protein
MAKPGILKPRGFLGSGGGNPASESESSFEGYAYLFDSSDYESSDDVSSFFTF